MIYYGAYYNAPFFVMEKATTETSGAGGRGGEPGVLMQQSQR